MLLAANLIVGLMIGDFGAASRAYQTSYHAYDELLERSASRAELDAAQQARDAAMSALGLQRGKFWAHIWIGIIAALVTLLVNSISVTYFIGTNRWSREVVEQFRLNKNLAERSQQLKRTAFPWALLGIVLILFISALGAASDPATLNPNAADWVTYHWSLAMAGIVIIATCFAAQVSAIAKNYDLIKEIMDAAEAERERRRLARESKVEPQTAD